jgi:hypothetical protein
VNRFFIVSTPRSGNVYMRRVLTGVLGLPNYAVWTPAEARWDEFPPDLSLAIHWRYSRELEGFVRERGFRITVTARHPLDVLLSILHYAPTDNDTNRWLEGEAGDERALVAGTTPVDEAFVRYALSWRFAALLEVSTGWAPSADALLRYAEFVTDPRRELETLLRQFGLRAVNDVDAVVREHSPQQTQARTPGHYWQGAPNHWRRLIVPKLADAIRDRHPRAFTTFGFACDPDPDLTEAQALANWRALHSA